MVALMNPAYLDQLNAGRYTVELLYLGHKYLTAVFDELNCRNAIMRFELRVQSSLTSAGLPNGVVRIFFDTARAVVHLRVLRYALGGSKPDVRRI